MITCKIQWAKCVFWIRRHTSYQRWYLKFVKFPMKMIWGGLTHRAWRRNNMQMRTWLLHSYEVSTISHTLQWLGWLLRLQGWTIVHRVWQVCHDEGRLASDSRQKREREINTPKGTTKPLWIKGLGNSPWNHCLKRGVLKKAEGKNFGCDVMFYWESHGGQLY